MFFINSFYEIIFLIGLYDVSINISMKIFTDEKSAGTKFDVKKLKLQYAYEIFGCLVRFYNQMSTSFKRSSIFVMYLG